jgi:mono/diheme cytochrome c family protein
MTRPVALALAFAVVALVASACGSDDQAATRPSAGAQPSAQITHGKDLFQRRCSGCHTLAAAGAQGAATDARQRGPRDGPNFDKRKVDKDEALFAIRMGGFGGDRMPANIVSGDDAEAVAAFVARSSGRGG